MEVKSIFQLLLVSLILASDNILSKFILNQGVTPVPYAFVKSIVGTIFLSAFILTKHKKDLKLNKKHLLDLVIIALSIAVIGRLIGLKGLSLTTATNLAFLRLTTFVTAFLSFVILKEKLPKLFWVLLIIATIGIWLLSTEGRLEPLNKGDALILFSTLFYGFGNTWAKKTMKDLKPIIVVFGRFFLGSLFMIPVLFFFGASQLNTINNAFVWVVLSGVLSASWVFLSYTVVNREGASLSNAFTRGTSPIMVVVFAYFLLGEVLSLVQIIGAAVILFSVLGISKMKAKYEK